jgi:hypothetical protein
MHCRPSKFAPRPKTLKASHGGQRGRGLQQRIETVPLLRPGEVLEMVPG